MRRNQDYTRISWDLFDLTSLGETSNDSVVDICPEVDAECKSHVMQPHNIAQFFAAGELHQTVRILDADVYRIEQTLFSLSHLSSNCFLPCCKTGRASSRDSR